MKKSFLVAASALIALFSTQLSVVSASAVEPVCTINVTQSNDQISGTNLGDVICITGDNNVVNALGGDDTVIDDGTDNTINLGEGFDTYDGTGGNGSTVDGGSGDDNLIGTPGPDELSGGDGDDTLIGGEEDDTLNGGPGADDLSGNAGDDTINGEAGPDDLDGGDGADILNGGDADDTLIGGIGNDTMNGGLGADQLQGDAGADNLYGEAGTDTLSGGEDADFLAGGEDLDSMDGGAGLNICDYDSGESITRTCIYDDDAPVAAGSMTVSNVEVGQESPAVSFKIDATDATGIVALGVTCRPSGDFNGGNPVLEGIFRRLNTSSAYAFDWATQSELGSDQWSVSGSANDLTVSGVFHAKRGSVPGIYKCFVIGSDILSHEIAFNSIPIGELNVTRSTGIYDDDAPVAAGSMTVSNVEVGQESPAVSFKIDATDATGIVALGVTCRPSGDFNGGNPVLEGIFRRLNTSSAYAFDWATQSELGSDQWSVSGSANDLTVSGVFHAKRGSVPGIYKCFVIGSDILSHEIAFNSIPIGELNVTRSTGIYDDDAPVAAGSMTVSNVEVGQESPAVSFKIDATDATGIVALGVTCRPSGDFNGGNPVLEGIFRRLNTSSAYAFDWATQSELGSDQWSVSGSANDLTVSGVFHAKRGSVPGIYKCFVIGSDILSHEIAFNSIPIGELNIYRTPAGQPSSPLGLEFAPVKPTTGKLSWSAPLSLGDPALYAYVTEYSTDGTAWKVLPKSGTNATSLDVSGLKADTDYWFRVRGENGGTVGQDTTFMNLNWATIKIHTPAPVIPDAPANLVVSNVTSSGYKLAWTAPVYNGGSAITDFKVEASSDGGKTWKLARAAGSTSLSVTVSGAAPGTSYQVRVSAINGVGASDYLTGSVTTDATAPTAPRNLTSKNIAPKSLTLSWLLPSTNGGLAITDYKVEVSSNGGTIWTVINDGVSTNLAADISNLLKNRSYKFRVTAINSLGAGAVSDVYTVSTLATVPSTPSALIVKDVTATSVVLSWSAPSDFGGVSLTDYKVETSRDGMTWAVVTKSVSLTRSLKLTGLAPGTTYQVRISAINSVGASDPLSGSVTTLAVVPTVPRSLKVTSTSLSTATLAWSLPASNGGSAITDYKVEVSSNCSTFTTISRAASKNLGFKVTGLKAGTKYCFRVSAKNSVGFSDASSELIVVTDGNAPNAPTSLAVKASTTSVTLSWKAATVTDGSPVRNYIVEYSKNSGSTWVKVSKPVSTSLSLKVTGLKGKTTYLFRVTAVNDVGNSKASKNLKVVTG